MQATIDRKTWVRDMIVVLPFSLLLVVMNLVRAIKIPITHDETGYGPGSYGDLIFPNFPSANNHILHSVLRKFFVELFGENVFILRLDSVLAHIGFLAITYLLCRKLFNGRFWVWLAFIAFNIGSPFLFEFWGLSRGYALAIFMMTVSIYYLLNYHSAGKLSLLGLAFLFGGLAVYANFSFLNYYVSLCGVVLLSVVLFREGLFKARYFWQELLVMLACSAILAALITPNLLLLHSGGELNFLGTTGFVEDTVKSLVDCNLFMRNLHVFWGPFIRYIVVFSVLFCAGYWLVVLIKNRSKGLSVSIEARYSVMLLLLLLIPAVSLMAQNKFFGITYLVDRTALLFIPLFLFNNTYFVYQAGNKFVVLSALFMMSITFLFARNFFRSYQTEQTRMWWYDAGDLAVLDRMERLSKGKTGKIVLRVNGYHLPAIKYDISHFHRGRFQEVEEIHGNPPQDTLADYYFIWNTEGNYLPANYVWDTSLCGGACNLYKKRPLPTH